MTVLRVPCILFLNMNKLSCKDYQLLRFPSCALINFNVLYYFHFMQLVLMFFYLFIKIRYLCLRIIDICLFTIISNLLDRCVFFHQNISYWFCLRLCVYFLGYVTFYSSLYSHGLVSVRCLR